MTYPTNSSKYEKEMNWMKFLKLV